MKQQLENFMKCVGEAESFANEFADGKMSAATEARKKLQDVKAALQELRNAIQTEKVARQVAKKAKKAVTA